MKNQELIDNVRMKCRVKHLAYATEKSYAGWVKRYVIWHAERSAKGIATTGAAEVSEFLTMLAVQRGVSASTQNQAFAALLFLYAEVLGDPLGTVDALRAKRSKYLPTVFSRSEVAALLAALNGTEKLMASILYGSGLRLAELLALRIKDIDQEQHILHVRRGKGDKDQPAELKPTVLALVKMEAAAKIRTRPGRGRAK